MVPCLVREWVGHWFTSTHASLVTLDRGGKIDGEERGKERGVDEHRKKDIGKARERKR